MGGMSWGCLWRFIAVCFGLADRVGPVIVVGAGFKKDTPLYLATGLLTYKHTTRMDEVREKLKPFASVLDYKEKYLSPEELAGQSVSQSVSQSGAGRGSHSVKRKGQCHPAALQLRLGLCSTDPGAAPR